MTTAITANTAVRNYTSAHNASRRLTNTEKEKESDVATAELHSCQLTHRIEETPAAARWTLPLSPLSHSRYSSRHNNHSGSRSSSGNRNSSRNNRSSRSRYSNRCSNHSRSRSSLHLYLYLQHPRPIQPDTLGLDHHRPWIAEWHQSQWHPLRPHTEYLRRRRRAHRQFL